MCLHGSIVVASRLVLRELLLAMDENTCEDAGQDLSATDVSANLVYSVDMKKTTAFQKC
jgi:hypothetical protein